MQPNETHARTFRAKDPRSALAAVKAALGPEAMIISTRELPATLFRSAEIEVTAAPGEAYEQLSRTAAALIPWTPPAVALGKLARREQELVASRRERDRGDRELTRRELAERDRADLAERDLAERNQLSDRTERAELLGEVQGLRRALAEAQRGFEKAPAADALLEQLGERGFDPALARELIMASLREVPPAPADGFPARLDAGLRRQLARRLPAVRAPWLPGRRKVLALVGPPGVGKTTTLAKLAARALLVQSGVRVALITIDSYRIGAREHLGRYGEIMDVPTHVAGTASELVEAVRRSSAADLILIDTAGRSDPEAMAHQAELTRAIAGVELHLVLSAANSVRQMAAQIERYQALRPERLLFTRLDESVGRGAMLTAVQDLGGKVPISCVADGQRVPEDLHAVTPERLAELALEDAPAWPDATQPGKGRA